eukprot:CAMPEP_0183388474 /NCGR_PEP_ID=MMETSP0370-20130417/4102_1 /TAXON_ID=268820 /ORGANISM="Peridinium aciculiferum, Strain PAER-2" /LENGTH=67 /DNA_ID=CAMNT_0025567421 /DNA_START=35 /DNA_END=234 /DNA_ORIENTATION=-
MQMPRPRGYRSPKAETSLVCFAFARWHFPSGSQCFASRAHGAMRLFLASSLCAHYALRSSEPESQVA